MLRYAVAVLAVAGAAQLVAEEKSECLAVGSKVAAFYVTDVTGPAAGEKLCYRCRFGGKPVVSMFVREVTPEVAKLVKEVDNQVAAHQDAGMRAFVVLLTENPEADAAKLKQLAADQGITHTPLTTFDGAAGPAEYKVGQESAVTVMMWTNHTLKVNDTFKAGELAQEKIPAVVGKTSSILN